MWDALIPAVVTAVVFGCAVIVIKIISDNRIRRRLIESGQVDEKVKYLYFQSKPYKAHPLSSIKWGMVLIGIGAAIFLGRLFPYEMTDEVTFGFMFLFSGIAFVVYFFLAKKEGFIKNDDVKKE